MVVTAKQMNEYARDRGYTNWYQFLEDVDDWVAQEALKQIELEDK